MEVFAMGWSLIVAAFLFVLAIVLLLSVFGLPGNWIMIGLVAVCHFAMPAQSPLSPWYWVIVLGVAIFGEAVEFLLQIRQSKKYGSSGTGTVGGVIGALIGAVCMAPLFFGIGAFLGALIGAWTGCFLFELLRGTETRAAARAALGAMFGRFLGTVWKLTCGVIIWVVTLNCLWPDPGRLPFDLPWIPRAVPPPGSQVLSQVLSLAV